MMIAGLVVGFLGALLMGIAAFQFVSLEQAELKTFPEKLPLGDRQQDSAIRHLEAVVKQMIDSNKTRASKQIKANRINLIGIGFLTAGFILQLLA